MKQEFYDRLKEVIRECEEHPYKNTEKYLVPGWEARMSNKNLGEWTDDEYDIIKNHSTSRPTRYAKRRNSTAMCSATVVVICTF